MGITYVIIFLSIYKCSVASCCARMKCKDDSNYTAGFLNLHWCVKKKKKETRFYIGYKSETQSSLVAEQVKDLALSVQWLWSLLWQGVHP